MITWPQADIAAPIASQIEAVTKSLPGWQADLRNKHLAHLILETKPNRVVEFGVYAGRSFISQALALKYNEKGIIYGFDPYKTFDPYMDVSPVNAMKACVQAIHQYDLGRCATLVIAKSEWAPMVLYPYGADIIHIDGS